ncbi:MAG: hypothetical protein RL289_822 [Actinomycetota bacterium]|jgi:hypothetical protein
MSQALEMKNSHDEQNSDSFFDLQAPSLSAQQVKQRNTQILKAANDFSEAIDVDAFSARESLVQEIFERLQIDKDLTWKEHAKLSIALCDIRTRDGLLRKLHDAPELRGQFLSHLIREVSRSTQEFTAPLATVYAGIAWLEGQTQLTRLAVDHALQIDAAYSLAQLLDIALRHNVPPSVWSSSLAAVSFDACLKGAA